MQAGSLKYQITVKRCATTVDTYGQRTDSWSTQCTTRAARIVQPARRAFTDGEIWYPRAAVFKVRLGTDVQEGDRIECDSLTYDVVSVITDTVQDRSITVNCELHNE